MQPSEEIKQKLDIVDLIRDYIPLKAAGMNFRAKCPFHQEKTPSFMVSPDKQIYHCFGCGKGGDIFSFIQEIEGVDFAGALRILAPKAGVLLTRQDPKKVSQRNRSLDIVDLCAKYYHRLLMESAAASWAREYLKRRGLSESDIADWQIGYAPDAWETVIPQLKKKGYSDLEIFQAGMSTHSAKTNKYFDRFRDRIVFPIRDVNGNTVGFTARVNPVKEETEKMGKYINSPQSEIYDKSSLLFGLDKAKLEIKKADYAIIVEGQMDAITAHVNGFKNVVASSGTALTADQDQYKAFKDLNGQINLIKRYTSNIMLAFDMDKAGEMAANRGIQEAMALQMNIKVIELPQGKDPDECIRTDANLFREAVRNAKPMMQYFFDNKLSKLNLGELPGRRKAVEQLLPIILKLGNKVEQDHWIRVLSQKVDVAEQILRETVSTMTKKSDSAAPSQKPAIVEEQNSSRRSKEEKVSEMIIALLIKIPALYQYALENLRIEEIEGAKNKSIYNNIILYYNNHASKIGQINEFLFNLKSFQDFLQQQIEDENDLQLFFSYLNRLSLVSENEFIDYDYELGKKELAGFIKELKIKYIKTRINEIEQMLSALEKESGDESRQKIDFLMDELAGLSREYKILSERG